MKAPEEALVHKRAGEARAGQKHFVVLNGNGQIVEGQLFSATRPRDAAMAAFRTYMRDRGRALAKKKWRRSKSGSIPRHRDHSWLFARDIMAQAVALQCHVWLESACLGKEHGVQHSKYGAFCLMVREWLAYWNKHGGEVLTPARAAKLQASPRSIRKEEMAAAIEGFRDRYMNAWQRPLTDEDDARFMFHDMVVISVKHRDGGDDEAPQHFMCMFDRVMQPTFMEIVKCVVYRTRCSKVQGDLSSVSRDALEKVKLGMLRRQQTRVDKVRAKLAAVSVTVSSQTTR